MLLQNMKSKELTRKNGPLRDIFERQPVVFAPLKRGRGGSDNTEYPKGAKPVSSVIPITTRHNCGPVYVVMFS